MTLGDKQEAFAYALSGLLEYAYDIGYGVRLKELLRTKEQAEIYAASGKGILNSVHRHGLAIDLVLSIDGQITWDRADYEMLGQRWENLHEFARWGGRFRNRDAMHFSFEHRGIK